MNKQGLGDWLPRHEQLPEGASRIKTTVHTFLANDGYYYTGNELEHHFKEATDSFWGVNRVAYDKAVYTQMKQAFQDMADAIANDMYAPSDKK